MVLFLENRLLIPTSFYFLFMKLREKLCNDEERLATCDECLIPRRFNLRSVLTIYVFYLYARSNTSILAQKKKNQKKKASRKRALDRRHSEGSESEKHDDEFDEKVSCGRVLIAINLRLK